MWKHMNLNGSSKYISIFAYQYSKLSDLKSVSDKTSWPKIHSWPMILLVAFRRKLLRITIHLGLIFLLNQKSNFYNGGM